MELSYIRRRIKNIFGQEYHPFTEQNAIRGAIDELQEFKEQLRTHGSPEARELLNTLDLYVQDLQSHIVRQLLKPIDIPNVMREGLEETLYRLGEASTEQKKEPRFIIEQTNTDFPSKEFKHIPYNYVTTTSEEAPRIINEIRINNLHARQEYEHQLIFPFVAETQWNLVLIHAEKAWNTTTGKRVSIGIIDTGINYRHEALRKNFLENKGYNFIQENADPDDDNGHGTHVAGTTAGTNIGVAPGSTLYALKILDRNGRGGEIDFIRACEYAIDNKLDVLNASLGGGNHSNAEQAVINALHKRGISLVAAAGNDGTSRYSYPASYDHVLSVAAITREKRHARFSQRNDRVDIAAPGVGIYSSYLAGYRILDGTSMATPHVTGSLALVRSLNNNCVYAEEILLSSTEDLGTPGRDEELFGKGLVRPDKAIAIDALVKRWSA